MKNIVSIFFFLLSSLLAGCISSTSPGTVTTGEQFWAQAAEDAVSIGLVPVLEHNPSYLAAAQSTALALGTFSGTTLTTADIVAFLAKTPLALDDQKTAAGIISAAWGVYSKHYAQTVGAAVRPDVKLFLSAVSAGILNAAAAVPTF